MLTIDVKGVAGSYDWPAGNIPEDIRVNHFIVLVTYNGKIRSLDITPDVWVIPHKNLAKFIRQYHGRRNVSRAEVKSKGKKFYSAWKQIVGENSA